MVTNTNMETWAHARLAGDHLDPRGLLHAIYCFPEI